MGALGAALVFLLARRLFASVWIACAVAAILALAPGYYMHARMALNVLYPVPVMIVWLLCMRAYIERPRASTAALAGGVLGFGIYSYLGAALFMPLYLAATVATFERERARRASLAACAGAFIALLPFIAWHVVHPERLTQIGTTYRIGVNAEPAPVPAAPGPNADMKAGPVLHRVGLYWEAFNPGRLFLAGESSLTESTRRAGTFLLATAVLLPIGIAQAWRRRTLMDRLLLFCLVTAPMPVLVMADLEVRRWLVVMPPVALLAGAGLEALWTSGSALRRAAAVALVASLPIQFVPFVLDYLHDYPQRAAVWFGGNIEGAVEAALRANEQSPAPAVVLSTGIPWVEAYWRFYTTVRGASSMQGRVVYRPAAELPGPAETGTLVVAYRAEMRGVERGEWTLVEEIPEPGEANHLAVYRKVAP